MVMKNWSPRSARSSRGRTEDEEVPARKEGPQFDPNDFGRTLAWALAWLERLRQDEGNPIRLRATRKKFDEEMRAHEGKKVRWKLQVLSIRETSVELVDTYPFGRGVF